MNHKTLRQILVPLFPFKPSLGSESTVYSTLEFVPCRAEEREFPDFIDPLGNAGLSRHFEHGAMCVRLVTWERKRAGEPWHIRDVKEQEVALPRQIFHGLAGPREERLLAFCTQLKNVLEEVLARDVDAVQRTCLPNDLFAPCWSALELKKTATNFDAPLRKKSRLGRYL